MTTRGGVALARFGALGSALVLCAACERGPVTTPAPPPPAPAPVVSLSVGGQRG